MIPQAPELFDGGYWVAVPVLEDGDGRRPDIGDVAFCAWYDGDVAYVRTLAPVLVVTPSPSPIARKPRGRIGGQ